MAGERKSQTSRFQDLIGTNHYIYKIISDKTNLNYLTEENGKVSCHFFEQKQDAESYMNKKNADGNGVSYENCMCGSKRNLLDECYRYGADNLIFHHAGDQTQEMIFTLDNSNRYACETKYEQYTSRAICFFLQDQNPENFQALATATFIVPAHIDVDESNGVHHFKYPTYKTPKVSTGFVYLVFSDIDNYNEWYARARENLKHDYEPLRMSMEEIIRVCKYNGVVINIHSKCRLVLSPAILELLVPKSKEKAT